MKSTILIGVMMFPGLMLSQDGPKNPCNRLEKGYQWMKDSLELTVEQQAKITALKSKACSSLNVAKSNAGNNKETFKLAAKQIVKDYRMSARKELQPNQLEKLKKARKNSMRKKGEPTPEKRASNMTERMKSSLGLDSSQVSKVYASNLQFVNCQAAVKARKDSGADSTELRREMMNCGKEQRTRLKAILTPQQWTKYEAMQKEKKEKLQERKKPK
jgi:hypothetical protein